MKIANFNIGNKKTFIIAEIGNNHNGSQKLAYQMIDSAIEAGADECKSNQEFHGPIS